MQQQKVIRNHKSKKGTQYNNQKKNDRKSNNGRRNITQKNECLSNTKNLYTNTPTWPLSWEHPWFLWSSCCSNFSCPFLFCYCVVCASSNYGYWLSPLVSSNSSSWFGTVKYTMHVFLRVAEGKWRNEDNASLFLPDNILYVCLTIPFYSCYVSLGCMIGYDKYRMLQYHFLFKICH